MGVREQTVSEWRRGTYRPELERLAELAAHLNVSREMLLVDEPAAAPSAVMEAGSVYVVDQRAQLSGRAMEIEALLAYALDRQRQLRVALDGGPVSAPATVSKLDETTLRQLEADAAAQQQKRRGTG